MPEEEPRLSDSLDIPQGIRVVYFNPNDNPIALEDTLEGIRLLLPQQSNNEVHEGVADDNPSVVVVGSFRFKSEIDTVIEESRDLGIHVLAPNIGPVVGEVDGFKILACDVGMTPVELWACYKQTLTLADYVLLYNKDGHFGNESINEIRTAVKTGVRICAIEPIDLTRLGMEHDEEMVCIANVIIQKTPAEFAQLILSGNVDEEFKDQFWYIPKKDRGQVRISPAADDNGPVVFVDFTNHVAQSADVRTLYTRL